MKKIIFLLSFFFPLFAFSQLSDNFEDDDISDWSQSETDHWEASNINPLNGIYSLHHAYDNSASGHDQISINFPNVNILNGTTTWQFQVKHGYAPSSSNDWACFLFSDADANQMFTSGTANGYAVGVNYSGSDDTIRIWKVTSGSGSEVINTHFNWEVNITTSTIVGFQVSRTASGEWTVFIDTNGGFDNLVQIGSSVVNTDHITANYFGFFYEYSSSQDLKLWIDDVSIMGTAGNNDDSQVSAGTNVEPVSISSLVNSADGLEVLDFQLTDLGTSDGLSTIINNLTISQGTLNNISDWTNVIAGAKLFGTDLTTGIDGVVNSTGISFSQAGFINVGDNTTENYQLYVWLKTDLSAISDNDTLDFKLDYNDIVCDVSGSSFGSGIVQSGDIFVAIEATKLNFSNPPLIVEQNQNFSLVVNATDINGNKDEDYSNSVTLSLNTGTGNLTSASGLTQNLVSGEYTWTDLQYNVIENFSILAESSGLTSATTSDISCSDFVYFLNDDFEDGNIVGWTESNSGHWAASDIEPINGIYSLHHIFDTDVTDNYTDKISFAMSGFDVTADSSVWQFQVKYGYADPSSTNNWNVFIMADADYQQMQNGGTINGYVVGVNLVGTDDLVKLCKITNGTPEAIISTTFDWKNIDENLPISIVVSRSITGDWEIKIDEDGSFNNLISYGIGFDNTFTDASYFGVNYNYTKTGDVLLWLDDIYVGPPIPDTEPPFLSNLEVISPNNIRLEFNEDVDKTSSETLSNYFVDNSIGNPSVALRNSADKRIVDLTFISDFQENTEYTITINNVEDIDGNIIAEANETFYWENLTVSYIRCISYKKIDIYFSKQIDSTTAVQLTNYIVDNSIGNPLTVLIDEENKNLVHLTFGSSFVNEQSYIIHIENIEDIYGNIIESTDYEFVFYIVKRYDIVVNELMVDVNPAPVALPANKYIEILNVSNYEIDLTNWTLQIGDNNLLTFPNVQLSSGEYAVICVEEAESLFSPYGTTIPVLNESYLTSTTGKTIILSDENSQIVEQITYDPETWYGDEDKDDGGWAMERIDPFNFCSQVNNWHASENYTGGTPCMVNSVYGSNPDTEAPYIEGVTLVTSCDIIVDYSETVDTTYALSLINYILNSEDIPFSILVDESDNSIVWLHFLDHFLFSNNQLVISNINDYCGNEMPDTTLSFFYELINPVDVEPKSSTQLKVYFSEPVELQSAQNYLNYSVNNGIGNPIVVTRDANDTSIVHLLFSEEFVENQEYLLDMSGLTDVNGNTMVSASIPFTYHIAQPFDIVINEMMLDYNPAPLGLPEAQYVELFNTTAYDIWLSDWIFKAESQSERVFPSVKIPSNGFLLMCTEENATLIDDYGTTVPILGTTDLTQSGKELLIYDNRDNLIYHVRYSDAWYNDEEKDDGGWSLEKIDPFNFCENSYNWAASVDIKGGTPGNDNSVYKINADTNGIKLVKVIVKSSNRLIVQFSKSVSFTSGLDVSNYNVVGIGNPVSVSLVDTSYSTVNLFFDTQFVDQQSTTLQITNVTDDCGNTIEATDYDFTYYLIHPEYVWVLNQNQLQVKFSEEVDYASSLNKDNYTVDNSIGTPNYVVRGTEDPSLIFLQFSTDFTDGETYQLSIANIEDVNGNIMENAVLEFIFYKAKVNDVVINEVLFNPYTSCVDFVELYNRSIYPINMLDLRIAKRDEEGLIESPYKISQNNYLLMPNEYLVITTDTANVQGIYSYGGKFIELSSMPSYPDDEGTVVIYDENDTIIDEFRYNENFHFGLITDQSGVSLERIDFNRPAQDSTNWHSASANAGFATPGLKNSQYINLDSVYLSGTIMLEPEVISPDNDGYDDELYIHYNFPQGGYLATVMIFDKNGRLVRELVNDEYIAAEGFWIWDGLDENSAKVRIGIYAVVVKIFNLDGDVEIYKSAAVVSAKQ